MTLGQPDDTVSTVSLSVIIPAFNEADYLPLTLDHLQTAARRLEHLAASPVEIVVVDNGSTDRTAEVARSAGVTVVYEAKHNIARARNVGAMTALHDVLIFLDADTLVPPELLLTIACAMGDTACVGGSVDTLQRPRSPVLRAYLGAWRVIGLAAGMAQGACQFCARDVFQELGGYDETHFMGEDADFYWRLSRLARHRGMRTCFIGEPKVTPSPRRFDRWPLWRTLVWTNPLVAFAFRRRKKAWSGWYEDAPR